MEGKLIYLRILEETDVPLTQKWINDPEISKIMGYLPVFPLIQQLNWYKGLINDQSRYIFAICDNKTNDHIGNVGLGKIDYINRHAMFNIFIANPKSRSKGIGTESTLLILKFAFNRLNLNKIYLQTSESFKEANRMYNKIGFKKDGILRHHYFTNGIYEDKIIYSILKEEFNG